MRQRQWTPADKAAFATNKLRASTIPARKQAGPTADEWDWDDDTPTTTERTP